MNKAKRRQIKIKNVKDVSTLGQISKQELLADTEKYDKDNYNPLENLEDKEIHTPANKTETITIRLTKQENETIRKISSEYGLSKSAFLRMIIKRSLSKSEFI
jgi:predicted DNA binding CopG/RHH family protein